MSADIPEVEPTGIQAGDSLLWNKSLKDYQAGDGWALSYAARGSLPSQTLINITATADGDDFSVDVPSTTTGNWVAGRYTLVGYVTDGTDRFEVYRGTFTVTANVFEIGEGAAFDGRSTAERLLERVTAEYEDALRAVAEYGYNGVNSKLQLEALSKERDKLKAEVAQEQARGKNRRILTRFRRP